MCPEDETVIREVSNEPQRASDRTASIHPEEPAGPAPETIDASHGVRRAGRVTLRVRPGGDLRRRLRELQAENQMLRRASRAKDEFLAAVGHELRNGVTAVLGGVELLGQRGRGLSTESRAPLIELIESNARHLLGLLDDVLDLCRASSGRMQLTLRPVPVAEICTQAVNLVEAAARSKRLALSLEMDHSVGSVRADRQRLRQILGNLLGNAVKFTQPAGRIGLRARPDHGRAVVSFEVWDTGPGLTEAQVARLREYVPFTQFEHGRQRGGFGLGLSLVKQLVDLHGGRLFIRSRRDAGSTFVVEIPAATGRHETSIPDGGGLRKNAPHAPAPASAGKTRAKERLRVQIVDDHAANVLATSTK